MVGADPVFGLRQAEVMGMPYSVVDNTSHFRKQRWPGVENWYVISMDGGGSPVWSGGLRP